LRRPWKTTRRSCSTSRETSWRIASAVFFLGGQSLLDRPCAADLPIDFHQLAGERAELAELRNFGLRLAEGGLRGKVLSGSLAADLLRELKVGAMAGVARFGAMAAGLAAAADSAGNRAGLEIAEFGDPAEQRGPVIYERGKWVQRDASLP
jgi:hypothetical protein